VFGLYADKHGRKAALIIMITLMAIGTGLLGFLPTYAAIGIAAPLLLLLARLVQGFSAGGEFGSASAMLIEFAPEGRRGYYGAFQMSVARARLRHRRSHRLHARSQPQRRGAGELGLARAVHSRHSDRAGRMVSAQEM
jgi:hypothetical protein